MALTRDDLRASLERAGDEHLQRLRLHHEEAYPASRPTPGMICAAEAERLNALGLGDAAAAELLESYVERVGDQVGITHWFRRKPAGEEFETESYLGYAD